MMNTDNELNPLYRYTRVDIDWYVAYPEVDVEEVRFDVEEFLATHDLLDVTYRLVVLNLNTGNPPVVNLYGTRHDVRKAISALVALAVERGQAVIPATF